MGSLLKGSCGMNKQASRRYSKPVLITLGTVKELTQSFNRLGGGDQQFSILDS